MDEERPHLMFHKRLPLPHPPLQTLKLPLQLLDRVHRPIVTSLLVGMAFDASLFGEFERREEGG